MSCDVILNRIRNIFIKTDSKIEVTIRVVTTDNNVFIKPGFSIKNINIGQIIKLINNLWVAGTINVKMFPINP